MTFEKQHQVYIDCCEQVLSEISKEFFTHDSVISTAASYSLLNGGKRVRGVITLAVCDLICKNINAAKTFAGAIEMVHAFSLIHDDLPCMDDDDVRRGKPANHIKFGEANALLAGDLLAIQAFEVMASANLPSKHIVKAVGLMASHAGAKGMIYGQELDIAHENRTDVTLQELNMINKYKTGALFSLSAKLGIVAAEHDTDDYKEIISYATNIGLVFQIVDDVLDATATQEMLGKPIGSDENNKKLTFVSVAGMEKSKETIKNLTIQAVDDLQRVFGKEAWFLCEFAQKLAARVW